MVNKAVKALIIIACISTGIVAVLLAPLQIVQYDGTRNVQYSGSVDQINLITNCDLSNVEIRYATDPTADLINLSYHYIIRHAIIFSPPNVTVSFINSTVGTILTVQLTADFIPLGFTSIATSIIYITINPGLLSNLSIHVGSGNINLDNTNSQNKTFIDVDLKTASGNINANLANNSRITGNLSLCAISGNPGLDLGENTSIEGSMQVQTTSGNVGVLLRAGVTLQTDFLLKTVSGNVNLEFNNLSLANNAVMGTVQTTSGNIHVAIQQLRDLSGNLTLDATTDSGNVDFHIDLEADYLSSYIAASSKSGIIYIPLVHEGFERNGDNLDSETPDQASNIDADLHTESGNVYIYPSRT